MNDFFQTLFGCLSSMYEQGWDNFLYDNGAYTYFGLILLIVPSIIAGIFYFADTARFNGRLKWFLFMLISFLLVMAITYGVGDIIYQSADNLDQYDPISLMDKFGIAFIGGFWGTVWFILMSLIMMLTSTHNYKVPIKS